MLSLPSELLRIDPLTGCKNFLGFLETGMNLSKTGIPREMPPVASFETCVGIGAQYSAILFVEMKHIGFLNQSKGFSHGDSAIRWMGILLSEESNFPVYRLGGEEFGVYLNMDSYSAYEALLERIHKRMDQESKLLGFPGSPADIALIIYNQPPASFDDILLQMGEAMVRVKNSNECRPMIFSSTDLPVSEQIPYHWIADQGAHVPFTVRWLSRKNIYQVLEMGRALEGIQKDAYTDAISSLPNMKAAIFNLEQALQTAKTTGKPFAMMMIDGDNFRIYNNNINYAAGDQLIQDMSVVLKNNLRPDDFVARWRNGDEFIVILPNTNAERAKIAGERFRLVVKEAAQAWRFPITISVGIAVYPTNGDSVNSLIDAAESANKRAKQQGKDQVVLACDENAGEKISLPLNARTG